MKPEGQSQNLSGRLYEAFNNKTFTNDYTITVYDGHSGDVSGKIAYERLDYFSSIAGDYYTGFYELFDLVPGTYVAIAESKGYLTNFQRFYITSSLSFIRAFPMVPSLGEGQLALVLSWG